MKTSEFFRINLVAAALFILAGCSAGKNETNVELIQDMMNQKSLKSQGYDLLTNQPTNRTPPAGTVPRGYKPYSFEGQALEAEAKLVNPIGTGEAFEKSLVRGKDRYAIYCSVCHGSTGLGDGSVAQYFPLKPPPLVSDKVKAFKDGRIYHIITDGQGIMKNYATQIPRSEDRWAIVNYIRTLKKK